MESKILVSCFVIASLDLCLGILVEENDHEDLMILKQEVQLLKTELAQFKEKVHVLETVMAQPAIAFMAELGQTIDNPAVGRQIVFDVLHLNRGNAYNNVNGTFTAPVNGTYHFSLELSFPPSSSNTIKWTHVFLKANTRKIGYIYGDGSQTDYIKRSVTALVDLVIGDDVYAVIDAVMGDHKIQGCCMHSVFSGFLVRQIL